MAPVVSALPLMGSQNSAPGAWIQTGTGPDVLDRGLNQQIETLYFHSFIFLYTLSLHIKLK